MLAGLLLVLGCGERPPSGEGGEAYRADPRLEGEWTVVSLAAEPVPAIPINASKAGISFRRGLITWSIGCNSHDAGYRTEGDRLVILPRTSTAMACPFPQERRMEAALDRDRPRFGRSGELLVLETTPGPLVLKRRGRQPPSASGR